MIIIYYESDICKFCNKGEMVMQKQMEYVFVIIVRSMKYLIENENLHIKSLQKRYVFMHIKG